MENSLSRVAALALALVVIASTVSAAAAVPSRNSDASEKEHITNGPIAEFVGDNAAEIAWSTRGSAQMILRYGRQPGHLDQVVEPIRKARGRCHHARLDGLEPNTTYFFQVVDSDRQAATELGTFQTLKPGAPPVTRHVIVP